MKTKEGPKNENGMFYAAKVRIIKFKLVCV